MRHNVCLPVLFKIIGNLTKKTHLYYHIIYSTNDHVLPVVLLQYRNTLVQPALIG